MDDKKQTGNRQAAPGPEKVIPPRGFAAFRFWLGVDGIVGRNGCLWAGIGWGLVWLMMAGTGIFIVNSSVSKSESAVRFWASTGIVLVSTAIVGALMFISRKAAQPARNPEFFILIRRENGRDFVIDKFDRHSSGHMLIVQDTVGKFFDQQLAIGMTMITLVKRHGSEDEVPFDGQWTGVRELIITSKSAGETPRP